MLTVVSWNVNGLRACSKYHAQPWRATLDALDADVVCLQETKLDARSLAEHERKGGRPAALAVVEGWTSSFSHAASRRGYSGTVVYTRNATIDAARRVVDTRDVDGEEGRVVAVDLGPLLLVNVYMVNTGQGGDRVGYKEAFQARLSAFLLARRAEKPVVLVGDLNVCHRLPDSHNWQSKVDEDGHCHSRMEREWMDALIDGDAFVDSFRHVHGADAVAFSWWPNTINGNQARKADAGGWRLDYCLVDTALAAAVAKADIEPTWYGSDHCPVRLVLDVRLPAVPKDAAGQAKRKPGTLLSFFAKKKKAKP